ncbi:NAD(P)-binding domain-containing protein [Streptomyces sp. NBC_01549]|uniref:NADPH-dependent F420 reductase n=1 Tax=Streptomyces sp. NBC_01549 TaxID=2975874 RepID=UPI002256F699|nr:NAD(P)-binding domain-containing protein [Streptomyces sp. NBC_01549]MCX4588205.1 NAD(P)-binding domain-containing protein [Streptomyces sp. NBC_01549]
MSTISIIGLGNMAHVLGARAVASGHSVQVIGRDAAKAAALADELGDNATAGTLTDPPSGDIVVLAVPYAGAASVVAHYGTALTGKAVVDITNPFDLATFTDLVTPADSSAAQEIARTAAPGVHVVKAFNTLFSGVLAAGEAGGRPLDVFIAGDDAGAKASVASFIESLGLRPLDTGDLKMAHWLEGAGLLILGQASRAKDFSLSIKIVG